MADPQAPSIPFAKPAAAAASAPRAGARVLRHVVVPLALMLWAPPMMMVTWYTHVSLDGSLVRLWEVIAERGLLTVVFGEIWGPRFFGSPTAWTMLALYAAVEMLLMRVLPGKPFDGPPTPSGHVPRYKQNGVAAFVITLALYCGASFGLGLFSPSAIYDHFGDLLGALIFFSLLFCLALYFKGRFAPSPGEHGTSGNPLFDYYWGVELYPRVLGWDVKMLTNCRLAMMGWPLIIISFAAKSHALGQLHDGMLVAVALQLIYIGKFFWWESGYMRSLDIMHDRAGFYIVWGVLVWLPTVYTGSTLYLVHHPIELGAPLTIGIIVLGIVGIAANYLADEQRQRVRQTQGKTKVWGKDPVIVRGRYVNERGEHKESLLLASGWWGIARHFHYVPEMIAAFCWTAPVGFSHLLPWFYVIFLGILLFDRAHRDDRRCAEKYGADWKEYCARVPYKIIPGLV